MISVRHSIASPAAVLKVIQRQYPSIGARSCELLELGCNDNYRLRGRRQDYVFRLYRLNWWPERDIDEELRLLEILKRYRLNVCKPVQSASKKRYIRINMPEGRRFGALFGFLPGRQLAFNFGPKNQHLINLGEMLARLHTVADGITQPVRRWTIGFDNVVTQFLDQAPVVLGHRDGDLVYLHRLAGQLRDILLDQPEGAFSFGLCHGDLHTHNVMLQPDGQLAMFDFDLCGYSWRAYDLATLWWSLAIRNTSVSKWRAVLRGYARESRLTREEKKFMPWFVVFRHFEFLNFQLAMRPHIGTAWLGDNYYDFHLKFFKHFIKLHMTK